MKHQSFVVGLVIFAVLTAAITVYSGSLTNRWGASKAVVQARENLRSLPLSIGNWVAEKDSELGKTSEDMLEIKNSYIHREYKNTVTQAVIYVTIMLGPSGRVTVHTPEICFGGKDFVKEAERVSVPITVSTDAGTMEDSFWKVDFVGQSVDTHNRISFYYAHSDGKAWIATENARWTFSKERYAYKLQAQAYSSTAGNTNVDNVKQFLSDTLPVIHKYLTLADK